MKEGRKEGREGGKEGGREGERERGRKMWQETDGRETAERGRISFNFNA